MCRNPLNLTLCNGVKNGQLIIMRYFGVKIYVIYKELRGFIKEFDMEKWIYRAVALGVVAFLVSCNSDDTVPPEEPPPRKVLVMNKGEDLNDFSTLTEFVIEEDAINRNLYQKANKNFMGTRANDVMVEDDAAYFVLNSNNKLIKTDPNTYELLDQIELLENPKYIQRIRPNVAYVSSWEKDGVYKVNTSSGRILDVLRTGVAPGEITVFNDWVMIPNTGSVFTDSTVSIFSASTDTVVDTLNVGQRPNSIQISGEKIMYIMCAGVEDPVDPTMSIPGSIWKYNLDSMKMALDSGEAIVAFDTIIFDNANLNPNSLKIDADGRILYYMDQVENASIFSMDTSRAMPPLTPFLQGSYEYLAYDAEHREIYLVNDDGATAGRVLRFDESGTVLSEFISGTKPRGFGFE